jgi:hypothetical protein
MTVKEIMSELAAFGDPKIKTLIYRSLRDGG